MEMNNLQLGDTGDSVKILQEKLKILGFYNALITGIFGVSTEVGVRTFQREFDLDVTGIVTAEMWEILYALTAVATPATSNKVLRLGDSGSEVRELQLKLRALLYYTGPITSKFDLETENAVKRLQFNNDITTNGIVDGATWILIEVLYGRLNQCVLDQIDDDGSSEDEPYKVYVVKAGDTLYAIASRYGTTVDAIKRLNHLTSNTLSIGQELKLPISDGNNDTGSDSTLRYIVKPGDTLYAIASRYDTTVDEIKRLNNLSSNVLTVGQVLNIPTANQGGANILYTVQRGDTLFSIASRYGTTVDEIKRLNNLTSNVLSIGQTLRIPSTNSSYITYTVQRGDTLFSIASRYGTTVDAIKRLNNLTSNVLSIGQVLKITFS